MGTSTNQGEVLYDPADLGADRFVDTVLMRDLVNTAKHKADQAAQVRACWVAPASGVWPAGEGPRTHEPWGGEGEGDLQTASGDDNGARWYYFPRRAVFCPHVRADGQGYQVRVWLAGASSAGDRVDFGVVVAPVGLSTIIDSWGAAITRYPVKLYSNITSTTAAELTPDDGSHVITVARSIIDEALLLQAGSWTAVDDIGGSSISVTMPLLQVVPFAQSYAASTSEPLLYGFVAAEYVGKT